MYSPRLTKVEDKLFPPWSIGVISNINSSELLSCEYCMEYPSPSLLVLSMMAVVFPHSDWSSCIPVYHIVGQPNLSTRDFIPVKPELLGGIYAQNFEFVSSNEIKRKVGIIVVKSYKLNPFHPQVKSEVASTNCEPKIATKKTACGIFSETFFVSLLVSRTPMTTRNLGTHHKILRRYPGKIAPHNRNHM